MPIEFQTNSPAFPPSAATSYLRAAAEEDATAAYPARKEPEAPVVGFGENTISPNAAAVKTITTNLREARRLVPSLQDIQEIRAQRRAELRAEQAEAAARAEEAARQSQELLERRIPEANPLARSFESVQDQQPPPVEAELVAPEQTEVPPTAPVDTPQSALLQPSQQLDILA